MDSTHCTTRDSSDGAGGSSSGGAGGSSGGGAGASSGGGDILKRELYNLLVRSKDGDGFTVVSFYVDVHDGATVAAAINYVVGEVKRRFGIIWNPFEVWMDDSSIEKSAVERSVWLGATPRLCVWHILCQNARSVITGLLGTFVASKVLGIVWKYVQRGGNKLDIHTKAVWSAELAAVVDEVHEAIGSPGNALGPWVPYHPDAVKARIVDECTGNDVLLVTSSLVASGTHPMFVISDSLLMFPATSFNVGLESTSSAGSEALRCWYYLVNSLFKDYHRVKRVFPFMSPDSIDLCFVNNVVESFHKLLKYFYVKYVLLSLCFHFAELV